MIRGFGIQTNSGIGCGSTEDPSFIILQGIECLKIDNEGDFHPVDYVIECFDDYTDNKEQDENFQKLRGIECEPWTELY